jgi:hypothetical protein
MSDLFGKPTTAAEYRAAALALAARLERNERALLFPAPWVKALLSAPREQPRAGRPRPQPGGAK